MTARRTAARGRSAGPVQTHSTRPIGPALDRPTHHSYTATAPLAIGRSRAHRTGPRSVRRLVRRDHTAARDHADIVRKP